jgi:predicted ester cyclase
MSAEENKAVMRRCFEEFHTQRQDDILEEIIAPELLESTRRATDTLLTAFPDYRITMEEQVAEEDKVATVWSGSGTHQGGWQSPAGTAAPTGNEVRWSATTT